jgi:hypothetical protein
LDEDLARFNALLNGSRPSRKVIETTKALNKKHSSNSNSNSNLPIPSPPTKRKSTDLKPPLLHFIDVGSFIYIFTEIAHWWIIVVCSVQDTSIQRDTATKTSASLLPNNQVDAATKKLGDVLFIQCPHHPPARPQDPHDTTPCLIFMPLLYPMIFPQPPITLSV